MGINRDYQRYCVIFTSEARISKFHSTNCPICTGPKARKGTRGSSRLFHRTVRPRLPRVVRREDVCTVARDVTSFVIAQTQHWHIRPPTRSFRMTGTNLHGTAMMRPRKRGGRHALRFYATSQVVAPLVATNARRIITTE